jgi:hypothetical protein
MNKPSQINSATDLIADLQQRGVEAGELDEMVHDGKSLEASNINNAGLEAQIEYLVEQYGLAQVVEMTSCLQ